jgi:hypothetical protein
MDVVLYIVVRWVGMLGQYMEEEIVSMNRERVGQEVREFDLEEMVSNPADRRWGNIRPMEGSPFELFSSPQRTICLTEP